MGSTAYIETDSDEKFRLSLPIGLAGGKALLIFLDISGTGCFDDYPAEQGVRKWIGSFNDNAKKDFCSLLQIITHSYYAGDWDYQRDDFHKFIGNNPGFSITEEDYISTLETLDRKWTEIDKLINAVEAIYIEMTRGYLDNTDWFNSTDTKEDFQALVDSLRLAKDRGAKEVRIWFD
jgi:hypothetical protein